MKSDGVRSRLLERECSLSPHAVRSMDARRLRAEEPSPLRTEFQRDRDRIIHTNAFRRLKHKSQVFVAPLGDHYVTRLTHTVEVAQIGRTIARALDLNEDLVEAAALGHDIGHTPFGHIGEKVLDSVLPGGFHHSRHSVRIIEKLEKDGQGLNLTPDVVETIRRHSKPEGEFLTAEAVADMSLEAQIVRIADAVAYLTHDIGDAIRSGTLSLDDLPPDAVKALGSRHSERVNTLVTDIVEASWDATGQDPLTGSMPWIRMSPPIAEVTVSLRNFMFQSFYHRISDSREGRAAADIVRLLFEHYASNPDQVPERTRRLADSNERATADHVCGMTDLYALREAEQIRPGIGAGVFEGRI